MTRSAGEIERESDASREALRRDVAALKEKVKPQRMMRDAASRAKETGQRIATRTTAQAKDLALRAKAQAKARPVPFAIAGGAALVGAAWLVARGWKSQRPGAD